MNINRTSILVVLVLTLAPSVVFARQGDSSPSKVKPIEKSLDGASFEGIWKTGYGKLTIEVDGNIANGDYGSGKLHGTIFGNRKLVFEYSDSDLGGEGEFVLSDDGMAFNGKWRKRGTKTWIPWTGERSKQNLTFSGLWKTTYGKLRLNQFGEDVVGNYSNGGEDASISGIIKENRLIFRYDEGRVKGSGWFEVSSSGQNIQGKWRPDGSKTWRNWIGTREIPEPGKVWLIVLEADWESALAESEYAFADMLESYFKMDSASHVHFRKRSFHDSTDLVKFCREVKYLAEPVVLLISTHGTNKGITVGYETIGPKKLVSGIQGSSNIQLLHLSGCSMLSGSYVEDIYKELGRESYFPISGYKTAVGWDASAIGDFTYLSMLLIHKFKPERAAKQSILVSPFLGDNRIPGAKYQALGLSVKSPPKAATKNNLANKAPESKETFTEPDD